MATLRFNDGKPITVEHLTTTPKPVKFVKAYQLKTTPVEILRYPTDEDWERCKMLAMNTIGKQWSGVVSDKWKHQILLAGHSPIRTLMFTIKMEIPYYISTCFVRHKHGVEHYVSSQRNDRQNKYDRRKAPQDSVVTHIMDVNAQELMQIAHMRLCGQATEEMRKITQDICQEVIKTNPEFRNFLGPKCLAENGIVKCNEFKSCTDPLEYFPNYS